MLNRPEIKLVLVVAGMFVFSGTTVGLGLRSLSPEVSNADAFLLLFWVSLFWALISAVALFIRTRRQDLFVRFIEAEIAFRSRFGLGTERTRRASMSKWLITIAIALLIGFVSLAAASAVAFFHFRGE
jgi:hypothetical protein